LINSQHVITNTDLIKTELLPSAGFRHNFIIPQRNGREQIYFLGNSLGLQPKTTAAALNKILDQWSQFGVEAFFQGQEPWIAMHEVLTPPLASIVGALPSEIVVMNQLTVNLHLLFASFYKPDRHRYKIICESSAFPSDQYMLRSQVLLHNLKPANCIVEVAPRTGEYEVRTEDILEAIHFHGRETAVVFFSGVNYLTGQAFDIASITEAAHKAGALAAFDLAHAVGNISLQLHTWDVDFACWCSYKYLNSGPGAVAGAYIHERFHNDASLFRLTGWWGYETESRFEMKKEFRPSADAQGWQLSTPSPLLYASLKASLDIFSEAGMQNLASQGKELSDHLCKQLNDLRQHRQRLQVITPEERGCQVSIYIRDNAKKIFNQLQHHGVFADWREPGIIRVAPVPLYNTATEIEAFVDILKKLLQ
jgi:kynureninase